MSEKGVLFKAWLSFHLMTLLDFDDFNDSDDSNISDDLNDSNDANDKVDFNNSNYWQLQKLTIFYDFNKLVTKIKIFLQLFIQKNILY